MLSVSLQRNYHLMCGSLHLTEMKFFFFFLTAVIGVDFDFSIRYMHLTFTTFNCYLISRTIFYRVALAGSIFETVG